MVKRINIRFFPYIKLFILFWFALTLMIDNKLNIVITYIADREFGTIEMKQTKGIASKIFLIIFLLKYKYETSK